MEVGEPRPIWQAHLDRLWYLYRHARTRAGHPRLHDVAASKTWMASASPAMTRRMLSRSLRPFHIRRPRFINQRGQRFVCRHHLLSVASQPPDRNRMRLVFLLADNKKRRDFRQRMFANLVVDLLVAQIDLDAQARAPRRGRDNFRVFVAFRGDRGHDGLDRCEPKREVARIVFDQDTDKAL